MFRNGEAYTVSTYLAQFEDRNVKFYQCATKEWFATGHSSFVFPKNHWIKVSRCIRFMKVSDDPKTCENRISRNINLVIDPKINFTIVQVFFPLSISYD